MVSGLIARARSLWTGMRRGVDADIRAEFEHHMELRARDLVKSGMSSEDAARQARVEFGGTYNYKEAGREARGLRWFDTFRISWLDAKLGARMLVRYPVLTAIGSIAIGVAIAVGAGVLGVLTMIRDPNLPLDEGDRIIGIQVWEGSGPERRILHDFLRWRSEMRTVQDFGAFRPLARNLSSTDGQLEPVRGVAMSAAGFRVARVPPMIGRYFTEADELLDAPAVAVLGHDLWARRFGADSGVIGKTVLFNAKPHTVIGVMPPGFAFPVNYALWVPIRVDPLAFEPYEGPSMFVFGRLAPGATLDEARAELATLGVLKPEPVPGVHGRFRPTLMPFAQSWMELDEPGTALGIRTFQIGVTLLLIVIAVNVAILVYARTATRQGEIAIRSALGASRARVVSQLFGEALVLAAVGAALGLAILAVVSAQVEGWLMQIGLDGLPFWQSASIPGATLAYLVALAVLAAGIIGVVPGLQLTGRRVQASLKRLSGGGASVRMGRTWTTLIVAEVALAVTIMPVATYFAAESVKSTLKGPGFAANRYLSATVWMDRDVFEAVTLEEERAYAAQFAARRDELIRRLRELPEVDVVTFASRIPGEEVDYRIEVDSVAGMDTVRGREGWPPTMNVARLGEVAPGWFEAFGVQLLAGRTFGPSDVDSTSTAVVVNRTFVETVLQGRNPIGRRVRQARWENGQVTVHGPWFHIVGVVADFPAYVDFGNAYAAWYRVAGVAPSNSAILAIRTRLTAPAAFAATLRETAASVHPSLHLREVQPLDDVIRASHVQITLLATALVAVTLSVLILSAAAVYALMSVMVTQRRREIAIRMALGAERYRVLSSVFRRAVVQVGGGVVIGAIFAASFNSLTNGEMLGGSGVIIIPSIALFMTAVGVLSALGPARRSLAIQPSTVLKED
ncbi:MAG: ABC transporter permease [Gemmatimonadaceae bacterium]